MEQSLTGEQIQIKQNNKHIKSCYMKIKKQGFV